MEKRKVFQTYYGNLDHWCEFANATGIEQKDIVSIHIEPARQWLDGYYSKCTVLYFGWQKLLTL